MRTDAGENPSRYAAQVALVTGALIAGGYLLSWHFGVRTPNLAPPFVILFLAALFFGAAFALAGYVLVLATRGEPHPLRRVAGLPWWTPHFLARRVAPAALVFVLLGAFGTYKSLIAYIHPFAWDATLSDLDRLIFGTDPWRLTHAVLGHGATRVLDLVYGLWFPAWAFTLVYFGCLASEEKQKRFVTAFIAVWIVEGVILATIFSSAGPCYLAMIHHPYAARYAALFPLDAPGATAAQAMLGAAYHAGDVGAFKGISAMPSVHVGLAFLLVLAASGWWRVAAALFYAAIFLASVHLGWHYASDGIVATGMTLLCWSVSASLHRRGAHLAAGPRPGAPAAIG